MATRIEDVVVPERFTNYVQQLTQQKSRLIQSGAVVRDQSIDNLLAGGGLTFHVPSFNDLDDDEERVSTDEVSSEFGGPQHPEPNKIRSATEIAVRLSRNNSWSSMDLSAVLAGSDPFAAIGSRVADYWVRREQRLFISTVSGVFAMNRAAAANGSTHTAQDMEVDVSGDTFSNGVTNFTTEAFIDAAVTMGDSMEDLGLVMVHSVVYARMQKNNLIEFIPDSRGETRIPTFLGRVVIVDDGMPFADGVYESWLFGNGAIRLGQGTPQVPTEIDRISGAGNGGGQEVLYNRVEWCMHPAGHAYIGAPGNGGPRNGAVTNGLASAASWKRVFGERKQIRMARLVTREA